MDLQSFVTETLTQIIKGVSKAMAPGAEPEDGMVNPIYQSQQHGEVQQIEFDVAITVNETSTVGGEAGLKVAVFSASGGGETASQNMAVNRVQFAVPLALPFSKMADPSDIDYPDSE